MESAEWNALPKWQHRTMTGGKSPTFPADNPELVATLTEERLGPDS